MKLQAALKELIKQDIKITPLCIESGNKLPPMIKGEYINPKIASENANEITIQTWYADNHFDTPANGYGLLLGNEYNLFCLDVDLKHLEPNTRFLFYTRLRESVINLDLNLWKKLAQTSINTTSAGYHHYFRLTDEYNGPNNPALLTMNNKAIVELRTSAYAATYPSPGYVVTDGTPEDFWNHIPILTPLELFNLRTACLRLEKELNPNSNTKVKYKASELKKMKPIDHFNKVASILLMLEEIGYTKDYNSTEFEIRMKHPNNPTTKTSGAIYMDHEIPVYVEYAANGYFHDYTQKALQPHQVFAVLNDINPFDYKKINKTLYVHGYGSLFTTEGEKMAYINDNLREFCDNEGIYFNTFSNRICTGNGIPIDDGHLARGYEYLSSQNIKTSSEERLRFWNNHLNFEQVNPVYTYFKSCVDNYDGTDEFGKMLTYMDFEQKKKLAPYFQKYLVQIVAQGLYSGQSSDEGLQTELILALYSKEHGKGKTRFFFEFLRQGLERYFDPKFSHKELEQDLQFAGNILIVDDEASVLSRKEIERMKSLVSMRTLNPTLKYQNFAKYLARRAVLGITSNKRQLINDIFNRRMIALTIKNIDVAGLMNNININNLWGQLGSIWLNDNNVIYIKADEIDKLNNTTEDFKMYVELEEILNDLFIPLPKKRYKYEEMPFEHSCLRRTDVVSIVESIFPQKRFTKFDYDKAFDKLNYYNWKPKDPVTREQRSVYLLIPKAKVKNNEIYKKYLEQ